MSSLFPEIPEDRFNPPTQQEIDAVAQAIVAGWINEEEGFSHLQTRILYGLSNAIGIIAERKEEIRQHLYELEVADNSLFREADILKQKIQEEMSKEIKPTNSQELLDNLTSKNVPKDIYLQKFSDAKVGKEDSTWEEFINTYKPIEQIIEEK